MAKRKKRRCGECTECCTHLRCGTFHKPAGVACEHLQVLPAFGCGIHQDRPQECRDFKCAWLEGAVANELRPDRSGFIARKFQFNLPDGVLFLILIVHGEPTEQQQELLSRSAGGDTVVVGPGFEFGSAEGISRYHHWQNAIARAGILQAVGGGDENV